MLGVISIIIIQPDEHATAVNRLITEYQHRIRGRMGIPFPERETAVITLVVEASIDEVNTMTGRLGRLPGVSAKAAFPPEKRSSPGQGDAYADDNRCERVDGPGYQT